MSTTATAQPLPTALRELFERWQTRATGACLKAGAAPTTVEEREAEARGQTLAAASMELDAVLRTAEADPAVEFVRLGWRAHVSIDFRVPVRTPGQLRAMADAAWCEWAESFLAQVWPICSTVEFGREGSGVLYVTIPATRQQAHGGDGLAVRYPDDERIRIAKAVVAWARSAGADEISTQQSTPYDGDGPVWNAPGEHPYRVRIWWD